MDVDGSNDRRLTDAIRRIAVRIGRRMAGKSLLSRKKPMEKVTFRIMNADEAITFF